MHTIISVLISQLLKLYKISHYISNFIPQDPLILPLVIVEPFGGAPADLVEGIGSLAEELDVRVQVNY